MPKLGKYEIVRRLADRGITERYLAETSGETLVLYRLLPALNQETDVARAFVGDARLSQRISHPNVLRVREVGRSADGVFFLGEYARGATLTSISAAASEENRPIDPGLAASIVAALCGGLHEAHMLSTTEGIPLGLVHCSVSADNVLITRAGEVKLRAFGPGRAMTLAARIKPELLDAASPYLSPEQCRHETVDPRTDIFSAGTLLCELLCGRSPFQRDTPAATRQAIIDGTLPGELRDVPPDLAAIVTRALALDRRQRYVTAEEMQVALQDAIRKNQWITGPAELAAQITALLGPPKEDSLPSPPRATEPQRPEPREQPPTDPRSEQRPAEPEQQAVQAEQQPPELEQLAPQPPEASEQQPQPDPLEELPLEEAELEELPPPLEEQLKQLEQLHKPQPRPEPDPESSDMLLLPLLEAEPLPLSVTSDSVAEPLPAPRAAAVALPLAATSAATTRGRQIAIVVGVVTLLAILGAILVALLPSAEQRRAKLHIVTEPPGASVFVDGGQRYGVTPMTLVDLQPDKQYRVVIMSADHMSHETTIELARGQSRTLSVSLVPKSTAGNARLLVEAPRGARVYLDSELRGIGTVDVLRVQSGVPHSLVVTLEGHEEARITVEPLVPGEERSIPVQLTPKTVEKPRTKRPPRRPPKRATEVRIKRGKGAVLGGTQGQTVPR